MRYRQLGNSELQVSVLGLGSMTWGHQNSEAEAHQQIDVALAAGVNLIDTAEMYPTPTHAETWRTTERYIGNCLAASGRRDQVILASKIAGPSSEKAPQPHIRGGLSRHDRRKVLVMTSLASLRSSAARAAHRWQASSHICCNVPMSVRPWLTALFVRLDIPSSPTASPRYIAKHPKAGRGDLRPWCVATNVGAGLPAMRRAGGARS